MKFKITLLTLIIASAYAPLCASEKKHSRLAAARERLHAHRSQKAPEVPHAERQEAAPTMLDVVAAVEDEDAFIKTLRAHLAGNPGCTTWDDSCPALCGEWDKNIHYYSEDLSTVRGYDKPISCKSYLGSCYQNLRGCSQEALDTKLKRNVYNAHYPKIRCETIGLICQGANARIRGNFGMTLLHEAVYNNDYYFTQFLLKHGADVEARLEFFQRTPLHCAMESFITDSKTTDLLLQHNADVNVKDTDNTTPLMVLAIGCEQHSNSIIDKARLLMHAGAERHHRASYERYRQEYGGMTALEIARSQQEHAPCKALADFIEDWEKQPNRIEE